MNKDFEQMAARAAPAIFVVLWSTGFIATKYVLHNAEPLTYLAIRMAVVVGLMAVIVAIARPRWPDQAGIGHSIVESPASAIAAGTRMRVTSRAERRRRPTRPTPPAASGSRPGSSSSRRACRSARTGSDEPRLSVAR